jgi:aryl-alcohol dehydrogenase-like predicted oxidoreductase
MQYRVLGKTGFRVSSLSFGAWAIGGTWGPLDDHASLRALHRAIDMGVNFIDTADVYGDGHSERLIGRLLRERKEEIIVATKAGRGASSHTLENYTRENLTRFVEQSLENLAVETLDLLQLHCPPTEVYYRPEVFLALDELVRAGKIRFYGVSVERVEEALKAIEYPGVATVQIVFNLFRQRPKQLFFHEAARRNVGVIARLPLSSGMLTGKLTPAHVFAADDHRNFNREGAAFDRGETFSGVDYERGLLAVEKLKALVPEGISLSQLALRFILMHEAVSCAIPGARTLEQVTQNFGAAELPPLSEDLMRSLERLYEAEIKPHVHHYW